MERASLWVLTRLISPSARVQERVDGVPVEGFGDLGAAEAIQKSLERAAREQTPIGPSLRRLLPQRAHDITDAAKAAGLPPPDYSAIGTEVKLARENTRVTNALEYSAYCAGLQDAVQAWWAGMAMDISPEANAVLWEKLFPGFQFYALSRVVLEE